MVVEVGLVAVEAVEVHRLVVGDGQRGRETDPGDPETVVVRHHIELRALGEERGLEIPLLAGIGIGRAIAKVVDIEQRAQLKALIGIECHSGQRTEVVAGLDNLFFVRRSLGSLCHDLRHSTDRK